MKNFLILGGLYFVIGIPVDLLLLLFLGLTAIFADITIFFSFAVFFAYCELALFAWFLILFLRLVFKKVPNIVSAVQKEYPIFSVYLKYWGYASYIYLLFSLIFTLISQIIINEDILSIIAGVMLILWLILLIWLTITARKLCHLQK